MSAPSKIPSRLPQPTAHASPAPKAAAPVGQSNENVRAGAPNPDAKRKRDSPPAARNTRQRVDNVTQARKPAAAAGKPAAGQGKAFTSSVGVKRPTAAAPRTAVPRSEPAAAAVPPPIPEPVEQYSSSEPRLLTPKLKKRAAWDTKGRLEDTEQLTRYFMEKTKLMESQMGSNQSQLESSQQTIRELVTFRQSLQEKVEVKERENTAVTQELNELRERLKNLSKNHEEEAVKLKSVHEEEVARLEKDVARLKRENEGYSIEVQGFQQEAAKLKATIQTEVAHALSLESECRSQKSRLEHLQDMLNNRDASIVDLEKGIATAEERLKESEQKLREAESTRRKLHNTILELKGNIRVFCRVRPVLPSESLENEAGSVANQIKFGEGDQEIELLQSMDSADGMKSVSKNYPFQYDKVYQSNAKQGEVFEDISQLVQSALDGYNVCIFAYGQTGSGKTFTMEGPTDKIDNPEMMGMIPRAVQQIFETAKHLEDKGWSYTMEAQYLEIYNESIRDLLAGKGESADHKYDIRHDPKTNKTRVSDLSVVPVTTRHEVTNLLWRATQTRATGSTNLNERSSRSHSVFTLRLNGTNSITTESSEGILNLIDLAGSERLAQSGATGDRLKETQAINKSLSCLGDVIAALANKDQHIPYRNSKLTYLLQNSLGGNSKTLMFVNVSPLSIHFNETLNSLRFATKVNSCSIGTATARKNIKI